MSFLRLVEPETTTTYEQWATRRSNNALTELIEWAAGPEWWYPLFLLALVLTAALTGAFLV